MELQTYHTSLKQQDVFVNKLERSRCTFQSEPAYDSLLYGKKIKKSKLVTELDRTNDRF